MIQFNNYTSIGKAVLYSALGLQKNYTELITKEYDLLDESETGCFSCETFLEKNTFKYYPDSIEFKRCSGICNHCPNRKYQKIFETSKIYRNETNRYGYAPRLKKIPLLLFVVYHFLGVDKSGIVKNININELAEFLNCNVRSIGIANQKLVEYGYISISNGIEPKKYINVLLPKYKEYFALASEGGRGYYTCSRLICEKLITIDNIVALRFNLRELLEDDDNNVAADYNGTLTRTYKEIRRSLPDYCKPNVIRKSLKANINIFDIHMGKNNITFELNPLYQAKKIKAEYMDENKIKITKKIDSFNKAIIETNNTNVENLAFSFPEFIITNVHKYSSIQICEKDINDLASMSVQYSFELLMDALVTVYKDYMIPKEKIQNLGGLIRSKIRKRIQTSQCSKVAA